MSARARLSRSSALYIPALLVPLLGLTHPAVAQQATTEPTTAATETAAEKGVKTKSSYENTSQFGGANSVGSQLRKDDEEKEPVFRFESLQHALRPYFDFKARVNEKYGLQFGGDYNIMFQTATESLGENIAAGGVVRFFGRWTLLGRESGNTGTLVYKVENRHRLGTDIAPQQLGAAIGYAGLTTQSFNDAGWLLSNFFWDQQLLDNRLAFAIGVVDTTDYVDTYGLVSPWTGFYNLAFGTDPTIPAPNQGLGVAVRGNITENFYAVAGFADANGDPTRPLAGFDTFFDDHEYFTHIEVGWFSSWEQRFRDNIHVTAWHVDKREAAQVPDGWGVGFSFNYLFEDRWLPFVRAGYSDGGGGASLERSVSIGVGRYTRQKSDLIGIGLNWGQPSEETFGSGLRDQYTVELFYRLLLLPQLTITPDIQVLVNPALNPDDDLIAVFGVRARLAF